MRGAASKIYTSRFSKIPARDRNCCGVREPGFVDFFQGSFFVAPSDLIRRGLFEAFDGEASLEATV